MAVKVMVLPGTDMTVDGPTAMLMSITEKREEVLLMIWQNGFRTWCRML